MKKKRLISILILSIIAIFCFAVGCDKSETNSTGIITKSVTITNKQVIMQIGDVVEFNVELKGVKGNVSWKSDDDTVILVNDNGVAEALKIGRTKLTASVGGYSDSMEITVSNDDIPVLNLNKTDDIILYKNNTFALCPTISFKGEDVSETIDYAFVSDDESVATVAADGTITAKEIGECTITVTAEYRYTVLSGEYTVRVVEGNFVTLTKNNINLSTLNYGEYSDVETVVATAYKDGVEVPSATFTWGTDNADVATVEDGVITAKGVGTTKITVSFDGLEVYCNVSVSKPTINTGITFEYEALNAVELPEYEIDDFNSANIESILYGQTEVYKDGCIDKDVVVGSSKARTFTIITEKANYLASAVVYNRIIESKADFEGITESLARIPVDPSNLSLGYYRDGYIVLKDDIAYDGEFEPIAYVDYGKPDNFEGTWYGSQLDCGFKGEFDGNGHTVSGIVIAKSGGFFGSVIGSAYVHDLRLEDVVVKAAYAAGLTTFVYNTAIVENVYVSGEVDATNANIVSSYHTMGIFTNAIATGSATIKNCVAELTKPFDLSNSAKTKVSMFGYGYTCWDGVFVDCASIGSDRLLGMCAPENAGNIANEWDLVTERKGIAVYANEGEYLVAKAEEDGFTKDEQRSIDATCIADGEIVMTKDGEEDLIIVLPALGHLFVDGSSECQRDNCSATKISKEAEGDVKDGFDFTTLAENDKVVSVTMDGLAVEHTDGVITFENKDASMTPRVYTVSYESGNVINVSLTIYSVLIDSEAEFRAAHNYQSIVSDQYGSKVGGYFKLVDDITMTSEWTADDMFGFGEKTWYSGIYGFIGTIDGDGHTIDGLIINGAQRVASGNGLVYVLAGGGVIKNLTFTNAQMKISGGCNGGLLAAHVQGGTIENVKITVSNTEGYSEGNPVHYIRAGGVLLGEIGRSGENTKVTVNNVTVFAANADTSARLYSSPIACKTSADFVISKDLIELKNLNLVGFATLATWEGSRITTLDGLSEYFTCDNVKVYADLDEYNGIKVTTLDPVETDVKTGVDFAAMISGDIASVTLNDEQVSLTDGKLTYAKTDVSLDAKKYVITDTNGNKYNVNVTV